MGKEKKKKKLIFLDNGDDRIPNWLKEVGRATPMSRGLTPLEALEKLKQYFEGNLALTISQRLKMVSIIENALKDYENTKQRLDDTQALLWRNQKKLIVLAIIINKRVDVDLFYTIIEDENQKDKLWAYNNWVEEKLKLTQIEFDLLKEVLL